MEREIDKRTEGKDQSLVSRENDVLQPDTETNTGAPDTLRQPVNEPVLPPEETGENQTQSGSKNNARKGNPSKNTDLESSTGTTSPSERKNNTETQKAKSVKKTKSKNSVVAPDSEIKETEGSEKEPSEEVVNVNQYYPEVDILTSTLTSDCNVAETEDHKFGGEELPPPEVQITTSAPQVLAISGGGGNDEGDVGAASVASAELPSQREADNSTQSAIPEVPVNGFGVFAATQLPGEEEEPVRRQQYSISPEYDAVHIIKTKVTDHATCATIHQVEEEYEKALRAINKGMGLKANQSSHYIQRAEIFIQLCDFQSAILNYKKACFLEPENNVLYERLAFIFYFQGQVFFDQRLFAEALESFSRASEMLPDKTGFHTRSIACLAALQRHGECLALVNHRLEVDKHNPDLYIMRARLHEMFNNMTLCYYDIKDALALDEDHPEALALRAKMEAKGEENKLHSLQLSILGKNRESLQKMNIAIEMNPGVAEYHILRGALHRKLGDFNSAIDDFLLALDKADHLEDSEVYLDSQRQLLLTYNDFAVECFTKGYYEEAILLLNKAIKGEKGEKGLYINRGDCFFRQGELTFALQDYHQAMELDRLDTDVKSRISIIHSEFGVTAYHDKNYPEAESKFSLAIKYNPSVGQYYITRSRCRYMLEDMAGARQDLVMGLLLDPTNEEIISILSRLFPGKSVKEITDSDLGRAAKQALGNLSPMASPIRLQPIPQTPALIPLPQDAGIERAASGIKPLTSEEKTRKKSATFDSTESKVKVQPSRDSQSAARMKLQTPQLWSQITKEKKTINEKMKTALRDRKSLKYTGPRLKPLPPRDNLPTAEAHTTEKVDSHVLGGKKSTNWRKFGVGMGSLQAL